MPVTYNQRELDRLEELALGIAARRQGRERALQQVQNLAEARQEVGLASQIYTPAQVSAEILRSYGDSQFAVTEQDVQEARQRFVSLPLDNLVAELNHQFRQIPVQAQTRNQLKNQYTKLRRKLVQRIVDTYLIKPIRAVPKNLLQYKDNITGEVDLPNGKYCLFIPPDLAAASRKEDLSLYFYEFPGNNDSKYDFYIQRHPRKIFSDLVKLYYSKAHFNLGSGYSYSSSHEIYELIIPFVDNLIELVKKYGNHQARTILNGIIHIPDALAKLTEQRKQRLFQEQLEAQRDLEQLTDLGSQF